MGYLLCTVLFVMVAQIVADFPPFSTVLNNYYLGSDQNFLGQARLPSILCGATDALRVSHAMVASDYEFNIGINQYGWTRTMNVDCKKYIARANPMKQYLTEQIGNPFVGSSKIQYQGKKGVIIFESCSGNGIPTTHVDLYDGSSCKQQCYFAQCTNIQLFEWPSS